MKHALIGMIALMCAQVPVTPGGAQQAQTAVNKPATGLIVGRVADGVSGAPVSGALVRIVGRTAPVPGRPAMQAETVMTSTDGRFLFRSLPKGSFSLVVQKAGYMPSAYGRRSFDSAGEQVIDLDDGQQITDATIKIWPFATLTGMVLDEAGEPLVNTTVKACLRTVIAGRVKLDFATPTGSAYTDDRGVYRHPNLVPGDYIVIVASASATVPASVQDAWDQVQRDGGSSDLAREIELTTAVLPSLSGLRTEDFVVGFGKTATGVGGVYRRPAPGELPRSRDGKLPVYRTVFYPGVTSVKEATAVTLAPGEERGGVNFQLRPVQSVRLSGSVVGPDGPQPFMGLRLLPAGYDEFTNDGGMMNYVTITDARGAFAFLGVVPGQYTLKALRRAARPSLNPAPVSPGPLPPPPIPVEPAWWSTTTVSIGDQDVDGVRVTLRTGLRFTGRVEFDGSAPKPPADRLIRMRLDLEPADGRLGVHGILGQDTPVLGQIDASGRITSWSVPGGKYVLSLNNIPEPWSLKSITAGGRDVSTSSLELNNGDVDDLIVTLTDHPAKISGSVRGQDGRSDPTASVIAFPVDRAARSDAGFEPRRVKRARTSRDGSYTFIGLPIGDYFVVAIPDDAMVNWNDPVALDALTSKATRVRIEGAAVIRQDLQTIRAK